VKASDESDIGTVAAVGVTTGGDAGAAGPAPLGAGAVFARSKTTLAAAAVEPSVHGSAAEHSLTSSSTGPVDGPVVGGDVDVVVVVDEGGASVTGGDGAAEASTYHRPGVPLPETPTVASPDPSVVDTPAVTSPPAPLGPVSAAQCTTAPAIGTAAFGPWQATATTSGAPAWSGPRVWASPEAIESEGGASGVHPFWGSSSRDSREAA
jgi:hypothetical protein